MRRAVALLVLAAAAAAEAAATPVGAAEIAAAAEGTAPVRAAELAPRKLADTATDPVAELNPVLGVVYRVIAWVLCDSPIARLAVILLSEVTATGVFSFLAELLLPIGYELDCVPKEPEEPEEPKCDPEPATFVGCP